MLDPKRVIIATPIEGPSGTAQVHWAYMNAVRQLERAGAMVVPADILFAYDVARARSVAAWWALQRRDAWDWILWWDEDVYVPDTQVALRMLLRAEEQGLHVLANPYPRKRYPLEYPCRPLGSDSEHGAAKVVGDCVEVEHVPFGFTLTSRECIEAMTSRYGAELAAVNERGETVPMLFALMFADTAHGRLYLSEDNAFCHRWRGMGGKVHLYAGPGSPLGHVGGHVFIGDLDRR